MPTWRLLLPTWIVQRGGWVMRAVGRLVYFAMQPSIDFVRSYLCLNECKFYLSDHLKCSDNTMRSISYTMGCIA